MKFVRIFRTFGVIAVVVVVGWSLNILRPTAETLVFRMLGAAANDNFKILLQFLLSALLTAFHCSKGAQTILWC